MVSTVTSGLDAKSAIFSYSCCCRQCDELIKTFGSMKKTTLLKLPGVFVFFGLLLVVAGTVKLVATVRLSLVFGLRVVFMWAAEGGINN